MLQTEGSARESGESTRMKKRMEWRFHNRRDLGALERDTNGTDGHESHKA